MDKKEAKTVLVTAFRALDPEQRARLRKHAEAGTPICCGKEAEELALLRDDGSWAG